MKSSTPLLIINTSLLSERFGGLTVGSIVFMSTHVTDYDLVLAHECVHVRQFREDRLMPLKWLFSCTHKLLYEVEAYAVSVSNGLPISQALDSLYRLFGKHGLSRATLHKLLIEEFSK